MEKIFRVPFITKNKTTGTANFEASSVEDAEDRAEDYEPVDEDEILWDDSNDRSWKIDRNSEVKEIAASEYVDPMNSQAGRYMTRKGL